jgi:hypothetical protein
MGKTPIGCVRWTVVSRKWPYEANGRMGYIYETVIPNGLYIYDWQSEIADSVSQFGITQSDHRLEKAEVESKAIKRAEELQW